MAVITQFDELEEIQELEAIPVVDPVQEITDRAADMIEQDGWCQNIEQSGHKRCIMQALTDAYPFHQSMEGRALWMLVLDTVAKRTNVFSPSFAHASYFIAQWNDQPWRTKEEVIQVLRGV